MDRNFVYNNIVKIVGEENVQCDVPMSRYCTFRTGGNAAVFASPGSASQMMNIVNFAKLSNVPYYVIGNGSNLLVDDRGYDGLIIHIGKNMSKVDVVDNVVIAMAGATLAKVASVALEHGLGGLEFASGIPGTVGGAVYMNAGAYGGEMKDVVTATTYVDKSGHMGMVRGEEHNFGYRKSVFGEGDVILMTTFELEYGDKDEISAKMADFNQRRKDKQPLEMPSAGSTFKRPEGYFAGKLIEDCGLRGYSIGGAQVSEKHCGFVVNKGCATTKDILDLIAHIQDTVFRKFGVRLETEVKYLGGKQ